MKILTKSKFSGFTLVELLVVVLIIGVLAAIALPQYQTAVDKSRYATLMPMAKSVASAQEMFYMANGRYSIDFSYLDVQVSDRAEGSTTTLEDGTSVELSEQADYDYVKVSSDKLENNYVVYQDKSTNYPNEIHCEAKEGSYRAERLCLSLGGQKIDGYLTPGYETYVLEGPGTGLPYSLALASAGPAGWQSCDTYPCTKACTREVKAGYACTGTYNADHSYNELVCQGNICTSTDYKEDDKQIVRETCVKSGNVCSAKLVNTYDEEGRLLSSRSCNSRNAAGECTGYSSGWEYTYDENGNKTSRRSCRGYNEVGECTSYSNGSSTVYIYDENGHEIFHRGCNGFNADGSCSAYTGVSHEYMYDEHGNQVTYRICGGFNKDGSCWTYNAIYNYTYDENGNQISSRTCNNVANGSCSSYKSGTDYTYDENGNQTSYRSCGVVNADGSCASYSSGQIYTYDSNGNMTSVRGCKGYNADGSCNNYSYGTDYKYDNNGNQIWKRPCSGINADGSCSGYNSFAAYDYAYDEDGNQISQRSCLAFNTSGACTSYESGYADQTLNDEDGNPIARRSCSVWSGTTCTSWGSWGFLQLNGR